MGKVLMEITMSLDGYTTGPEVSAEAPFGRGGDRLHEWMFAGESAADSDRRETDHFSTIGAVIMELAREDNFAALTTIMPDGHPQTQVMWVDADGDHLLINTEVHRQKFKNVERDPRVTLTIWEKDDPYSFVEVRGEVVEKAKGPEAREHIDELSHKYHGRAYGTPIRSERVVLRIAALRQVIRTPS